MIGAALGGHQELVDFFEAKQVSEQFKKASHCYYSMI